MSNDVRMLLPVMVAIMIAKFVADAATHSLYHGLLEVKCVPFLPKDVSACCLFEAVLIFAQLMPRTRSTTACCPDLSQQPLVCACPCAAASHAVLAEALQLSKRCHWHLGGWFPPMC